MGKKNYSQEKETGKILPSHRVFQIPLSYAVLEHREPLIIKMLKHN